MGHSSLEILKRYLALAVPDCEFAHRRASPLYNDKLTTKNFNNDF